MENTDAAGAFSSVHPGRSEMRDRGMRSSDKICNCYALKGKSRLTGPAGQAKGACLSVSTLSAVDVASDGMQAKALIDKYLLSLPSHTEYNSATRLEYCPSGAKQSSQHQQHSIYNIYT